MPDMHDQRPAYEQIADDLRQKIKAGQINVGARLKPQREMIAEEYAVAAGTLQRALDVLGNEGVISRGSTRGTFVLKVPGEPDVSPEYVRLTEQLGEISDRVAALERWKTSLGSQGA